MATLSGLSVCAEIFRIILSHIYLSPGKVLSESEMGHVPDFEILVHLTWNDPYGQCSYIIYVNKDGLIHCSLLLGKSRVSPSKFISIPRLELTAAVLSVKVTCLLRKELQIDGLKERFWTDSQVVLTYIRSNSK